MEQSESDIETILQARLKLNGLIGGLSENDFLKVAIKEYRGYLAHSLRENKENGNEKGYEQCLKDKRALDTILGSYNINPNLP